MMLLLAFVLGCLVGGWSVYRFLRLGFCSMVRSGRLAEILNEYAKCTRAGYGRWSSH